MIYYLVGLVDKDSYKYIESMQKLLCEKYNLYTDDTNLPMLHITLEVITNPDLEALDTSLKDLLKHYSKFQVELDGVICFDPPYKSVNLNVNNKGTLDQLSKNINSILNSQGFSVRENMKDWNLHISLANTTFADREWSDSEYLDACNFAKNVSCSGTITVDSLELWKPINDKNQMVVKRYAL